MPCSIEGLYPQIVDFPYPIVIFSPQHTLVMVNKAFEEETNFKLTESGAIDARILRYKTNDVHLSDVLEQVFEGKTFYLEDITNALPMFSGIERQVFPRSDRYKRAVVFSIFWDKNCVPFGVIMFLP